MKVLESSFVIFTLIQKRLKTNNSIDLFSNFVCSYYIGYELKYKTNTQVRRNNLYFQVVSVFLTLLEKMHITEFGP